MGFVSKVVLLPILCLGHDPISRSKCCQMGLKARSITNSSHYVANISQMIQFVTFCSPIVGGHTPFPRVTFSLTWTHHPKKVTNGITRKSLIIHNFFFATAKVLSQQLALGLGAAGSGKLLLWLRGCQGDPRGKMLQWSHSHVPKRSNKGENKSQGIWIQEHI